MYVVAAGCTSDTSAIVNSRSTSKTSPLHPGHSLSCAPALQRLQNRILE
jgi:hypothetical protein